MPLKNIITEQSVSKEKLERSRELRREMTPAEKLLWQEVRANKRGVYFRRHAAPANDAGDKLLKDLSLIFCCHKTTLVIEVDGDIHDWQQEDDVRREKVLGEMGLKFIRFRNNEILKNLSAVSGKIREHLN